MESTLTPASSARLARTGTDQAEVAAQLHEELENFGVAVMLGKFQPERGWSVNVWQRGFEVAWWFPFIKTIKVAGSRVEHPAATVEDAVKMLVAVLDLVASEKKINRQGNKKRFKRKVLKKKR